MRPNGVSLEHPMAKVWGRKLDILWETKLENLLESLKENLLESVISPVQILEEIKISDSRDALGHMFLMKLLLADT